MPHTRTLTTKHDIAEHARAIRRLIAGKSDELDTALPIADRCEVTVSLFSDPGPDYSEHRFFTGDKQIAEFHIKGY